MVRTELTADDSLAAIRARSRFGIAMAAMIRMIATTISNSMSEKPFCFRISFFPVSLFKSVGPEWAFWDRKVHLRNHSVKAAKSLGWKEKVAQGGRSPVRLLGDLDTICRKERQDLA